MTGSKGEKKAQSPGEKKAQRSHWRAIAGGGQKCPFDLALHLKGMAVDAGPPQVETK